MTGADLAAAAALTAGFGWPHRIEDLALMLSLGEGVAADDEGALAGTAALWTYGPAHAALGMVMVQPGLQGRGLGRRLLQAVLDRAGPRSVALYATEAGAPLYRSLGFVAHGLVRQMQGRLAGPVAPGPEPVRPARDNEAALLDHEATGLDRPALLAALGPATVLDRGGAPAGFAITHRFGHGQVIGPVAAQDQEGARALLAHAFHAHPGAFVRVDATEAGGLVPWLHSLGLRDAGPALHMVHGTPAQPPGPTRLFALATQAFG